ncbi:MAG: methyltransferase domain-containing protein [Desulfovibrionaceae bacterium]|nr:methyltransferase domain-containing protein [Desulfovibrionaceae bacterium]
MKTTDKKPLCIDIPYDWFTRISADLYKNFTAITDRIDRFLKENIKPGARVAIWGAKGAATIVYECLARVPGVRFEQVIDRERPTNSLGSLPYLNPAGPADRGRLASLDYVFICSSPRHYKAITEDLVAAGFGGVRVYLYKDAVTMFTIVNEYFSERFAEYAFVFNCLAKYYPRRILDVGTGESCLPSLMERGNAKVRAIDCNAEAQNNPSCYVHNEDIQVTSYDHSFDLVTCVSVLEHVLDYRAALANMDLSCKPGGHVLITMPFNRNYSIDDIHRHEQSVLYSPDFNWITRVFSYDMAMSWPVEFSWDLVEERYYALYSGEGFGLGEPYPQPIEASLDESPDIACLLFQKR